MPPRSTPFQKVVHHIQSQLAPSASVRESEMLQHRLLVGEQREVDVVIRSRVGEHDLVVSLECIDHERPADVTWVEQMKTKHDYLETDKLILVSRAGFYKPARDLAGLLRIGTYTPEEAIAADWLQIVGKGPLFVSRYDFTPTEIQIRLSTPDGPALVGVGGQTGLQHPDGSSAGIVAELVLLAINTPDFASRMLHQFDRDAKATGAFEFTVPEEVYALDIDGRRHRFVGARVLLEARSSTANDGS